MLSKTVPRVRMNIWRVPEQWLEQAQDDATILAIRDLERAGIDIITDGEMRRESYSNRFATALEGIDLAKPGHVKARSGHRTPVPRVVGRIRRKGPVEVRDMKFLRANTGRIAKITLPGPFTMSQQAINEYYEDPDEMVMDYAVAVNAEAKDLVKAGADIIQLDEPWLRQDPDAAKRIAVKAINRALAGITVPTIVHLCFGYAALVPGDTKPVGYSFLPELADTSADQISIEAAQPKLDLGVLYDLAPKKILLGVIDLGDPEVETPRKVAERIRRGLKYLPAERLIPAPDCGMKYLPRETAFGKLRAMADGAAIVRQELAG
jgi:5-methyltetrahydropteroyltriglutamate--homocysteine methyltransferase